MIDIRHVQRVLIMISVGLYAATVGYFIRYRHLLMKYDGVPVPAWAIPPQVSHFVTLLQLTAVFAAGALMLEFIKLRGGVEDGGKAE